MAWWKMNRLMFLGVGIAAPGVFAFHGFDGWGWSIVSLAATIAILIVIDAIVYRNA